MALRQGPRGTGGDLRSALATLAGEAEILIVRRHRAQLVRYLAEDAAAWERFREAHHRIREAAPEDRAEILASLDGDTRRALIAQLVDSDFAAIVNLLVLDGPAAE